MFSTLFTNVGCSSGKGKDKYSPWITLVTMCSDSLVCSSEILCNRSDALGIVDLYLTKSFVFLGFST